MKIPLKVLLIEDNDDDALLVIRELRNAGYEPDYKQVCHSGEVAELLDRESWDIILSDYSMGQFTGLDALNILKKKGTDIPFIVVSGTIGEDVAVQTMKAGAHDYLMKQNLTRLVPAIRRELAEAQSRRDRRRTEREKEVLLEALQQRTKELQSIVFISSHDLRSPLVNIQGFAGELHLACEELSKIVEEEQVDYPSKQILKTLIERDVFGSLRYIKSNADKMEHLVAGLLKFSQIGTTVPTIAPVDMNGLMERILESVAYQIRQHNISVSCGDLPACLGEANLLDQVFTNLIDNAIKYRHPNRPLTLQITAEKNEKECRYYITDNGIGIETRYLDRIFEIFHKLHPPENQEEEGVGLGLTIVKSIVNRLNGKIAVESRIGEGSTFIVTLPKA